MTYDEWKATELTKTFVHDLRNAKAMLEGTLTGVHDPLFELQDAHALLAGEKRNKQFKIETPVMPAEPVSKPGLIALMTQGIFGAKSKSPAAEVSSDHTPKNKR